MKLYTEERVREMLKSTHIHTDNDVNMILAQFTPIELPSENEIKESSPYRIGKGNFIPLADFHRWVGAKWVIEQIKQQAK